ncbi:endo-beta-1,4-mannanase [Daphnia pulex]|uniref:Endo-beta-1,4-mannanase n=1 Tax=Daphnia pulex TaxID=6669 RepID=E9GVV8_DAPPU|nr:endo-beta-1,4-mannanase [Daphnia pulex]|eukprot:EFX76384.1 endo-beta-1,4-mannanase [Daphnia pulex]
MRLHEFSLIGILFVSALELTRASRLSVSGNKLMFNGKSVFLSGVNFAWNSYGNDFGNGKYTANSKTTFEQWLAEVATNGGNSVRVWLHVEGDNTPNYDANGYVLGPDKTGTLISDMKSFLDSAKAKNILVIFVLWNGATLRNQNSINLYWDNSKLQTYLDKALTPMVKALAAHPALGAWEIVNEPEALVYNNKADANSCFNTVPMANSGAGWTGKWIPMKQIQLFINWQAAAIKAADPGALVTVGTWSQYSQTDVFSNTRNYYTDACLIAAGGKTLGKLDFYQIHTYTPFSASAPFKVAASAYGLNKPVTIGEFSASCSGGMTIQQMYNYAYGNGYQAAWGWQYAGGYCSDSRATFDSGMLQLKGKSGSGGLVNFPVV